MWYWNQDNFEGLAAIAAHMASEPPLREFADYCRYREQGLRKQAFAALERFIEQALSWPFEQRKQFVDWLLGTQYANWSVHQLIAHPLWERLIAPTLEEWIQADPRAVAPLRWRGIFSHDVPALEQAARLDSHEVLARVALVRRLIGVIEFASHHLPDCLIGSPEECFEAAARARRYLAALPPEPRQQLESALLAALAPVQDWMAFQAQGGGDFAAWCQQQGRNYRWITTYYYLD